MVLDICCSCEIDLQLDIRCLLLVLYKYVIIAICILLGNLFVWLLILNIFLMVNTMNTILY